jgi:hypothetical protein
MTLTRQRSYACAHTTALALLVFAVAALGTVKLSEGKKESEKRKK